MEKAHHTHPHEFIASSEIFFVVHCHSGLGRYPRIEKHLNDLGQETEFLSLLYADESKLFVPPLSVSSRIALYRVQPRAAQAQSARHETVAEDL